MILFEVFVKSTHRVDILLPDSKQDLDVMRLAHRFSKRGGKFARFVEACFLRSSCRADHPRAYWRRRFNRPRLAHADLLSVIERKPEWVAKGGKRPLGGIGLGTFERKLVSLPRGRGLGLLPSLIPPAQS